MAVHWTATNSKPMSLFAEKPREVRLQLPQELLDQFDRYKKIVKRKSGRVPSYSQLIASFFMYDFKDEIEAYFAKMDEQTTVEEAAISEFQDKAADLLQRIKPL